MSEQSYEIVLAIEHKHEAGFIFQYILRKARTQSCQLFGDRGKALALTVQDAWLWRMHASMAVEDTTHRTFWRRLLRWLVVVGWPAMYGKR